MEFQKTIAKEVIYSGVGLHSGKPCRINFKPAGINSGIKFARIDLEDKPVIEVNVDNILGVSRGTAIGKNSVRVESVEHILAALSGMGIDNLLIETDNIELPVGDGSALPFVEKLKEAGISNQPAIRQYYQIPQPLEFLSEGVEIYAFPAEEFKITAVIDYNHPILKSQYATFNLSADVFAQEIAPARTYCFDYEIEFLRKRGLAKGGSLTNTIIVGEGKIHNAGILHFANEFVRHKILDLIGDLYLVGHPIKARIVAVKTGHKSNIKFAKYLSSKAVLSPAGRKEGLLNPTAIQEIIPHRPPFLLVDEITKLQPGKSATGIKTIRPNEFWAAAHFPGHPIMPGVLIIEALAQTAAVLIMSEGHQQTKLPYFMSVDQAKFRKPVFPGEQLKLEVEMIKIKGPAGRVKGTAWVKDSRVAEAEIMFMLVDKDKDENS